MSKKVLAFDFGASSGRGILGYLTGGKIVYKEIHRFSNGAIKKNGHLVWNMDKIICEIKIALSRAGDVDSIGFDTWGVDYGIIDKDNQLIDDPKCYRDGRTDKMVELAAKKMPLERLYEISGNQIMPINTLFQLMSEDVDFQDKKVLFMPDLFSFMLTGNAVAEHTIASTSQLFDMKNKVFSTEILSAFGLPASLFPPVVKTGTVIGNYAQSKVIAVAGHDTECALYAVPTDGRDCAILSCGTWSLLGVELDEPILSKKSFDLQLSNEISASGKYAYLKNIVGLWLIQECKSHWNMYSFSELAVLASEAKAHLCVVDPDDDMFAKPCDMPSRIQAYCRQSGQVVPQTIGEISRCIYESLALKYRFALEQIEEVTNQPIRTLYIVGGGSRADILCELTARATGRTVRAGIAEATALGNIAIQLETLGEIKNHEATKALIAKGEVIKEYKYDISKDWEDAYKNFKKIMNGGK